MNLAKYSNWILKNSLFKSCDESAKKAFTEAAEYGYAVLEINNKRVKYKMEYPVLYLLESILSMFQKITNVVPDMRPLRGRG